MSILNLIRTYNFDRPETEVLCDLIYVANKYELVPAMVTFGTLKELDPRPEIEDDTNTYITATVKSTFDYRLKPSTTGFLYTRIPVGMLIVKDNRVIIPPAIPFKTLDILDQINRQLGTRMLPSDVENIVYTTMDDDFVLQMKPTCRTYIGSRKLQVLGGGKKYMLYPDFMLSGFYSATTVMEDKKSQLNAIANKDNRVTWRAGFDYDFGVMDVLRIPEAGRNTRVFIKSKLENYIDQWVYFTRIDPKTINDQFGTKPVPVISIPRTPFTIYSILALINATLNLHLTAEDVEDTSYLPGLSVYNVTFKPTSMGWLPGVYPIKVEYTKEINLRLVGDGNWRSSSSALVRIYA